MSARSIDTMNSERPKIAQARPQGMNNSPTVASNVPTALACKDANGSP
jgi:hypothetical protein